MFGLCKKSVSSWMLGIVDSSSRNIVAIVTPCVLVLHKTKVFHILNNIYGNLLMHDGGFRTKDGVLLLCKIMLLQAL